MDGDRAREGVDGRVEPHEEAVAGRHDLLSLVGGEQRPKRLIVPAEQGLGRRQEWHWCSFFPEEVAPGALKPLDRYFATRPDWEKAEAGLRAERAPTAVGVEADAAGNAWGSGAKGRAWVVLQVEPYEERGDEA